METRLLRPDPDAADPARDPAVVEAAALLAAGGLVAFPTETVYGLGADAASASAVERVYRAKGRPPDNPCIVHLAGAAELPGTPSPVARRLMERFWPGPLTLVLPAPPDMRATVARGLDTVAFRVPDHPLARALLRACGRPLVAPSANRSGRPSPTRAAHVLEDLDGRIEAVLDGGPCREGIESTVVDLAHDEPALLRTGALEVRAIEEALGQPLLLGARHARRRSPGTRYRHYAPDTPVVLLADDAAARALRTLLDALARDGAVAWVATGAPPPGARDGLVPLDRRDPASFAWSLFDDLRALDRSGLRWILVEGAPLRGAVRDRVERAAALRLSAGDVDDRADLRARLDAVSRAR